MECEPVRNTPPYSTGPSPLTGQNFQGLPNPFSNQFVGP